MVFVDLIFRKWGCLAFGGGGIVVISPPEIN